MRKGVLVKHERLEKAHEMGIKSKRAYDEAISSGYYKRRSGLIGKR
ncbi:MAG: hypothetical protein WBD09_08625 [Halobacteriota archaeon]